jgi:hypothetical protein
MDYMLSTRTVFFANTGVPREVTCEMTSLWTTIQVWESIVHLHDRTYVQSMRCCIHLSVLFIGVFLSSLATVSIEFICYRHA